MRLMMLTFTCVLFFTVLVLADEPSAKLIAALIQAESGSNDNAIGDKDLKYPAYGCLQIRAPCVYDVNRRCGTEYRASDCLGNRKLSVWICKAYIDMYASPKRLGREPTDEDKARIWNGGPNGWKRKTTLAYWGKVKEYLPK